MNPQIALTTTPTIDATIWMTGIKACRIWPTACATCSTTGAHAWTKGMIAWTTEVTTCRTVWITGTRLEMMHETTGAIAVMIAPSADVTIGITVWISVEMALPSSLNAGFNCWNACCRLVRICCSIVPNCDLSCGLVAMSAPIIAMMMPIGEAKPPSKPVKGLSMPPTSGMLASNPPKPPAPNAAKAAATGAMTPPKFENTPRMALTAFLKGAGKVDTRASNIPGIA